MGYARTAIRRVVRDGRELVQIEAQARLALKRFNTPIETEIRFTSLETPDGQVLECRSEMGQAGASMTTEGRAAGGQFHLKVATTGKTVTTAIPWSPEYGGFYALQQSLSKKPMKPGERRTIQALDVGSNQVAVTELTARDFEPVKLLDGTKVLLRIDNVTTLAGLPIKEKGVVWTDRAGEIWKNSTEMFNIEAFRTTKEVALGDMKPGELDIGWSISVPVNPPLMQPYETRRVRYRVHLDRGDPAAVFVSDATQQVRSIDANTAEITVYAIRPGVAGNPAAKDDPPVAADREPNNHIQSDDPAIVAAAREAAGDRTDPWQVAVALERYTRGRITQTGYSQAFDSALDVLKSGKGDCTEHSVLLAALARARGIPARVAIGLVYQDQAFLYHMWNEIYVDGRWIPLDATRARGGTSAAYLKLACSSLEGASAYASMLPVAQVAGRLKVEIVEADTER